MNGRFALGAAGMGGGNLMLGIFGLVFTALLVAATIIAIVMLIDAARARGVEVSGGRLAGFWIVGLVLTPIVLALYVLCVKPQAARAEAPASDAAFGAPASPYGPGSGTNEPTTGTAVYEASVPSLAPQVEETVIIEGDATTAIDGASA